jgi:surfeit locus 1 family protein
MSRPQLFSAFRAAFPRQPRPVGSASASSSSFSTRASSNPGRTGFTFNSESHGFRSSFGSNGFRFGSGSRRHASTDGLHTASLRNTLLRPITLILMFAPILTGYLGVWQVQRLKWKVGLIEEVDRNLAKEPMALPAKIKYA